MEPMKPMRPMEPIKPMEPMAQLKPWWPEHLGQPASSGGQNEMRYAFFPDRQLLLVEIADRLTAYNSGDHQIRGVAQQQGRDQILTFNSQNGSVDLNKLKQIDLPAGR